MKIKYYVRNSFGGRFYLAEEAEHEAFMQMTGRKCLSREDRETLEHFGCEFERVVDPAYKLEVLSSKDIETADLEPELKTAE